MILDPLLFTVVLDVFVIAAAGYGAHLSLYYARRPVFQPVRTPLILLVIGMSIWIILHLTNLLAIAAGALAPQFIDASSASAFIHDDLGFLSDLFATAFLAVGFVQLLARISAIYSDLNRSAAELKAEIGSRDRAEEELLASAQRQRESSRLKSEFLVSISHELRTPLNGILGLASLLSNTGLAEDQRRLLGTLEQSAKAMLTRVSDVLDLARLESGQTDVRTILFNPVELAASIEALFQPIASEKGLSINVKAGADVDRNVIGDQILLRQALNNLVSNAIKYAPSGSVDIEVRVQAAEAERIWLEFEVVDTGIGVEQDVLDGLARTSGNVNQGEVGLGLAICWHIARLMDGQVTLERLSRGTRALLRVQVQCEPETTDSDDAL